MKAWIVAKLNRYVDPGDPDFWGARYEDARDEKAEGIFYGYVLGVVTVSVLFVLLVVVTS